jgi:hypothetical protein
MEEKLAAVAEAVHGKGREETYIYGDAVLKEGGGAAGGRGRWRRCAGNLTSSRERSLFCYF